MQTLIRNASIVNEGSVRTGSVVLEGKRIAAVLYGKQAYEKAKAYCRPKCHIIEAEGQYLIPGILDDQVHFREPGQPEKGTMEQESRAALLGGVTGVMDMPNNAPPVTTVRALKEKYKRAAESMYVHYAFYMGATNTNREEVLSPVLPGCGLKIFMGSSTGDMLVDDPATLNLYFKEFKGVIATHCEEESVIRSNLESAQSRYGENIPWQEHSSIRSRQACIVSTRKALDLAIQHNSRLHILHVSTLEEVEMIRTARRNHPGISCEAALPHLWFTDKDYKELGSLVKCNPSLKTEKDQKALRNALEDRTIQVIGSDHAPHTLEEKQNKYLKAPSGIPLVQHTCQMLMELVQKEQLSLTVMAEACCHEPARLFGIKERGFIREGYFADLVLIDPYKKHTVTKEGLEAACGWSPLEGVRFSSSLTHVFVNGTLAVKNNRIIQKPSVSALM
ncbi:MAG: dihydroorotase [Bacteroidales bacterium]|nr:dihydroorotase [Bacteroidales bacterium]